MKIVKKIAEMQALAEVLRQKGVNTGFVPTMGAFHEGHLSLIKAAKKFCQKTIVSIFVNPLQFGVHEDYGSYPVNLKRDIKLAKKMGVDILFLPAREEMYPALFAVQVLPGDGLTRCFEGASRPKHFQGVVTVVAKLFHLTKPRHVFFGQKDAQQVAVIRQMIRDLDWDVQLHVEPIVREADGVAMSSRHIYFNTDQRRAACVLYQTLQTIERLVERGERRMAKLMQQGKKMIKAEKLAELEYLSLVQPDTFHKITEIKGSCLIILAVKIGKVRLLDNLRLEASG